MSIPVTIGILARGTSGIVVLKTSVNGNMPKKKKNPGFHRLRTMTLHEGLAYLRAPYQERKIDGFWVESKDKTKHVRLQLFKSGLTDCVSCGMRGTHFHIERHWNDRVMPFSINLYGMDGEREVMMTWDHMLPVSLGGSNDIMNAQTMCANCNSRKGNQISLKEILEIVTNPYVMRLYRLSSNSQLTLRETIRQVQHEYVDL